MTSRVISLSLAVLCLAAAAGCGTSTAPTTSVAAHTSTSPSGPTLTQATMAFPALSGTQAPDWVAYKAGYFTQNHVDMHLEYIAGSPVATAALLSGHIQFETVAGPAVVASDAKGAHLVMVMGFVNEPTFVMMVSKSITTPGQLAGKTIAIVKAGSSDAFILKDALALWHLTVGNGPHDVRLVPVGSVGAQVAALKKGLAQGAMVNPPNNLAAAAVGAHRLASAAQLGIPYQASGLVTSDSYIRSHRNVVSEVVKAMVEGVHRYETDPAFTRQVLSQYLKTASPKSLTTTYSTFVHVFPKVPAPTAAGMRAIVKQDEAAHLFSSAPPVAQMLDTTFIDQLQQDGFISHLWAASSS